METSTCINITVQFYPEILGPLSSIYLPCDQYINFHYKNNKVLRNFHKKNKTIERPSYVYNGNFHAWENGVDIDVDTGVPRDILYIVNDVWFQASAVVKRSTDGADVTVSIKLVRTIPPVACLQVFNVIFRRYLCYFDHNLCRNVTTLRDEWHASLASNTYKFAFV